MDQIVHTSGPSYFFPVAPIELAFIVSAVFAYPIYRLLLKLNSRQTISEFVPESHQKKQGTPTMGGLIVAVGFLVSYWVTTFNMYAAPSDTFAVVPLLYIGFALIGFVDDYVVPRMKAGKRGLGWKQKILMQVVVATACALILNPGDTPTIVATVFLILFFSNAYNFSDGLDSLAGLLLLGFIFGLEPFAPAGFGGRVPLEALMGAILPFLYYNRSPAKVFMGDVGSLPIGAILGLSVASVVMPAVHPGFSPVPRYGATTSHLPYFAPWPVLVAVLLISGVMIAELVPVPLQILSVKLRKKRLFSFTPIHHAYERKGWPEEKVVMAFAAWQFGLGMAGWVIYVMLRSKH